MSAPHTALDIQSVLRTSRAFGAEMLPSVRSSLSPRWRGRRWARAGISSPAVARAAAGRACLRFCARSRRSSRFSVLAAATRLVRVGTSSWTRPGRRTEALARSARAPRRRARGSPGAVPEPRTPSGAASPWSRCTSPARRARSTARCAASADASSTPSSRRASPRWSSSRARRTSRRRITSGSWGTSAASSSAPSCCSRAPSRRTRERRGWFPHPRFPATRSPPPLPTRAFRPPSRADASPTSNAPAGGSTRAVRARPRGARTSGTARRSCRSCTTARSSIAFASGGNGRGRRKTGGGPVRSLLLLLLLRLLLDRLPSAG